MGGRGPCVLADTAELPSLADIQLAHLRLRALCLPGELRGAPWGHPKTPRGCVFLPLPPLKARPVGSRCGGRGEVALGPGGDTLAGPCPVSRDKGALRGVGSKFTLNPTVGCPPQPSWHPGVMGALGWVHELPERATVAFGVP